MWQATSVDQALEDSNPQTGSLLATAQVGMITPAQPPGAGCYRFLIDPSHLYYARNTLVRFDMAREITSPSQALETDSVVFQHTRHRYRCKILVANSLIANSLSQVDFRRFLATSNPAPNGSPAWQTSACGCLLGRLRYAGPFGLPGFVMAVKLRRLRKLS